MHNRFVSTNEKMELRTLNSDRMSWAAPLMSAFDDTKTQLSLFRTYVFFLQQMATTRRRTHGILSDRDMWHNRNVLVPTKALLRTLGRHCARVV
jgi:hypothetical protein